MIEILKCNYDALLGNINKKDFSNTAKCISQCTGCKCSCSRGTSFDFDWEEII